MKKALSLIMILIISIVGMGILLNLNYYKAEGTVTKTENGRTYIYIKDEGCTVSIINSRYNIGDKVIVKLDNRGTSYTYDDLVVSVKG